MKLSMRRVWCVPFVFAFSFLAGCTVGPAYERPNVPAPPAFKELTPADFPKTDGWKVAQPSDGVLHGKWWQVFEDPELEALEEQVSVSNQNVLSAEAAFASSRALVRQARAQFYPTVSAAPSFTNLRPFLGGFGFSGPVPIIDEFELPFDVSWQPDLFGRIRNTVKSNASQAQASAADLENVRLTVQATLAVDYFELRGQDALKQLLDDTVKAYQQSLDLTTALYETGIDSDESVAQAETQLDTTKAQDTAVGIVRAQYEHAIAVLIGRSPAEFSIAVEPLKSTPVAVPFGVPSELLERRPDIAAAERLVAAANAQIGVAKAAFYPTLTLTGSFGFDSPRIPTWLTWPSRVWSLGPTLTETIFDAGLRRATVQQFQSAYNQAVDNYRQTVLTAFQQVEDNLSGLRIISQELDQQNTAVAAAERDLGLANDRYRLGIDPYLNVITAQATLLGAQQTAVNLRIQQMADTVQLVEALGGGWTTAELPGNAQVAAKQGH